MKDLNRKQKLSFLKNLTNGRANISDIMPPTTEFWQSQGEDWKNEITGQQITAQLLQARQEQAKRSNSIVWLESKSY